MITEIDDKKKLAALLAGVGAYLQAEQEAAVAAAMGSGQEQPAEPVRLWGASGRQDQMTTRRLLNTQT